jgi:chromosome segregation ATPase
MSNDLVQTGFFEIEPVASNGDNGTDEIIIDPTWADLSEEEFDQAATEYHQTLVNQESVLKMMTNEVIRRKGELYIAYKARLGHGKFLGWLSKRGVSEDTAEDNMRITRKLGNLLNSGRVRNLSFRQLRRISYSPEREQIATKLESGELAPTAKAVNAELEAAKRRNEELQEANQELQGKLNLFEDDRERERQELKNKLKTIENEKAAKAEEIAHLKEELKKKPEAEDIEKRKKELEGKIQERELERETLERELERLRIEARQRLNEDLARQRKELKESYAKKEQDLQLKAENTIHSLLSHGIKSMAETQLTIEHTVSAGMLQAVQQLGGKQVNSFLAQAESLQEELDRVIAKLTHGDYLVLEERVGTNV